ncbi:NAD(P)H-dependent oxidoreductase [Eubacterium sp. 1001713B170207_170306_E7]|uniref:NAD(P)H-dependent oxidoreductase n=1 Tax=Eubacterium sp. 1001713B170207_170306_E7 TaxID=2787097 RepID=UPI0018976FD6|nr:NAD(P)H-dependent oxidoreductase [Eubacterium sp. 1001713B170207_170306_E7]
MKVIIQDLSAQAFRAICPLSVKDIRVITNEDDRIKHCIGCFGCWVKTPGTCILKDGYGDLGKLYADCDELVVISKVQYGGYSAFIKNVMDRNIGYLLPFFTIRRDEMHHEDRYPDRLKLTVIGYGEDVTEEEAETFRGLVSANALNLNTQGYRVIMVKTPEEVKNVLEALE